MPSDRPLQRSAGVTPEGLRLAQEPADPRLATIDSFDGSSSSDTQTQAIDTVSQVTLTSVPMHAGQVAGSELRLGVVPGGYPASDFAGL